MKALRSLCFVSGSSSERLSISSASGHRGRASVQSSNPMRLWSWLAIESAHIEIFSAKDGVAVFAIQNAYLSITALAVLFAVAGAGLRIWGAALSGPQRRLRQRRCSGSRSWPAGLIACPQSAVLGIHADRVGCQYSDASERRIVFLWSRSLYSSCVWCGARKPFSSDNRRRLR